MGERGAAVEGGGFDRPPRSAGCDAFGRVLMTVVGVDEFTWFFIAAGRVGFDGVLVAIARDALGRVFTATAD